ncbi:MAG: NAD(P)/FAD-dependent oxidoreductase, partial [Pseudomonadota bacterium]
MNVVDHNGLKPTQDETLETTVSNWLNSFEKALTAGDEDQLSAIFQDDCHWRDIVAFTWHISSSVGHQSVVSKLLQQQPQIEASNFRLAEGRAPPRWVRRQGIEALEALLDFETARGRGTGVLRLVRQTDGSLKAWVMLTTLQELKGFEEKIGSNRPSGEAYSRNFGGENWKDQRVRAEAYADRDPAVLVVGGGQAGLVIAARLGQLGVDTLVVDKFPRIGDNWRKRYHSLALHNEIHANHLPYMPFPPTWPNFIPKDMLADWFEAYAFALEINYWTATEFVGGTYDDSAKHWTATVREADGSERVMHPRHLIFANGVSGIPIIPELPGLTDFKGEVVHSHSYTDGSAWQGKKALVLGTGNSGHDVAQDLHSHGADTTIIQRGSTTVVSIASATLNYALYKEGPSLEDCDLLAAASTYPLIKRGYQMAVQVMLERDKEIIDGLNAIGFEQDIGPDDTGHQMKYQTRGGGYYLDAGCSGLIIDGEIDFLKYNNIETFCPEGARLKDGTIVPADLIVLATGYYQQIELVRRLLGKSVADKVGSIWSWGEDGEMNNHILMLPGDLRFHFGHGVLIVISFKVGAFGQDH